MGVPGEAVERGKLKRPRLTALAALVFAVMTYLYFPQPAPEVAAPRADDCVELHLWTNGFHTDIAAPAEIFPASHALRRLYPEARAYLIGWGDERFYRSDVFSIWLALDAITPPSRSVMHIAYDAPGAAVYLGPNGDAPIAVSRDGATGFVAYVDRTLALDGEGAVIPIAPGKLIGRSSFLRARGTFHLFNVCNQWMARALRAAGLDVNARAAWLGGGLLKEVRRERPEGCAHSPNAPSRPI
jgi:uncharacterized protein (TIGR02117 family)